MKDGTKVACAFSHGRVAVQHDFRLVESRNVNPNYIRYNEVLVDELQGRDIEQYINEYMQPTINEYNAKQKRNDRKINEPYCNYWKNNGKLNKGATTLSYEAVISIGEHETLGKDFYINMDIQSMFLNSNDEYFGEPQIERLRQPFIDYYSKVLDKISEQYPHLKILYAVIHFDEPQGTPHLHVGYMGIGDDYKQGLSKQISICNALKCDGIDRIEKRSQGKQGYQLARFYNKVREEIMNPIAIDMGYNLKQEPDIEHPHIEKEEYQYLSKKVEQEYNKKFGTIEELDNQKRELQHEIHEGEHKQKDLTKEIKKLEETKNEVLENISDYNKAVSELEQEYGDLYAKNSELNKKYNFIKKVDNLMNDVTEKDIPFETHTEGLFKNKKTYYLVPENDLKSMVSNIQLSESIQGQFNELNDRRLELNKQEQFLIKERQKFHSVTNRYETKLAELTEKERQLEKQKSELSKFIEEKANELIESFLSEFPHIRKIYYDFVKLKRLVKPKKHHYQSHDFER